LRLAPINGQRKKKTRSKKSIVLFSRKNVQKTVQTQTEYLVLGKALILIDDWSYRSKEYSLKNMKFFILNFMHIEVRVKHYFLMMFQPPIVWQIYLGIVFLHLFSISVVLNQCSAVH
jgi:hypothetical protein